MLSFEHPSLRSGSGSLPYSLNSQEGMMLALNASSLNVRLGLVPARFGLLKIVLALE
jgi:hypothetical protein